MSGYWYPLAVPTLGDEEIDAATAVLRSRRTTMGEKVEEFEEAFARHVGASHGVMVNSGSSADLLIAMALCAKGYVIVPAVTWPTHVWSWALAGMPVVLVDVGELNTSAEKVADAITSRAAVVSIPHLMGVPCDLGPILEVCDGLPITEDCCEALGATYDGQSVGSFGEAASWSFFFSHHMTTMEGGMVTTDSGDLAERLRTLRSHGWARHLADPPKGLDPRYTFVDIGFNLRPTEVAAAIGLVQLGRLEDMNRARARNMTVLAEIIGPNPYVRLPTVPERGTASWFGVPLLLDERVDRDRAAKALENNGVETRPILAGNLQRQPAMQRLALGGTVLPGANHLHDHGLYVGLHPIWNEDVSAVGDLVNEWCVP